MALCIASLIVLPQLPSSLPGLATDMFTDSMRGRVGSVGSRWDRIQSSPQTYQDTRPSPAELRMRTAHRRTPGATPTTPEPLSIAPTVPDTCVPWPFGSPHACGLSV